MPAQAQVVEWVKPSWPVASAGTTDAAIFGRPLVDPHGHLYQIGRFKGQLKLDSTSAPLQGSSVAPGTLLLVKRAPDGTVLWYVTSQGGSGSYTSGGSATYDPAAKISLDSRGNVYVSSFYSNGMHFGNLTLPALPAGQQQPFVLKVSPTGQVLWAQAVRAPATVMANGDLVLTDTFTQPVTFGTVTLAPIAGRPSRYVVRTDSTGASARWGKVIGYPAGSPGGTLKITAHPTGNEVLVAVGMVVMTDTTMVFDGQTVAFRATYPLGIPDNNVFSVSRIDSAGTTAWITPFSSAYPTAFALGEATFSPQGDALVTGQYLNADGSTPVTSAGLTFPNAEPSYLFVTSLSQQTGAAQWLTTALGSPWAASPDCLPGYVLASRPSGDLYWVFEADAQVQLSSTLVAGATCGPSFNLRYCLARLSSVGQPTWLFEPCADQTIGGRTWAGEIALDAVNDAVYLQNWQEGQWSYSNSLVGWNGATTLTRFGQSPSGVTGRVFFDVDGDGVFSAADTTQAGSVAVTATNTSTRAYPDQAGIYHLPLAGGTTQTVSPTVLRHHLAVPATRTVALGATQWLPNQDFAIQAVPNQQDLVVSGGGRLRVGGTRPCFVSVRNVGTSQPASPAVSVVVDSRLQIAAVLTPGATVSGQTITWPLSALPLQGQFTGWFEVTTPSTNPLSTAFTFTATALPLSSDATPVDNTWADSIRATMSFDPNDLLVSPDGDITPAQVAAGQWLEWRARFQNTGTDTAFYVQIRDTLDASRLDLSTLELLETSHPGRWALNADNQLTWTTDRIRLPMTSASATSSQGFIRFRVKTKPTLAAGDEVRNRAHIYFDFNPPVATNQTSTRVNQPTGLLTPAGRSLRCYPNPTTGQLRLENSYPQAAEVSVHDALGRCVRQLRVAAQQAALLDLRPSGTGVYVVRLTTADGHSLVQRVVVVP